ncbi:MAG: DNA-directed RNA polymerase subunit beta', partial [Candidatus Avispirillum sp.]
EELFEARKPKKTAVVAEFGGTVEIRDVKKLHNIVITNPENGEEKEYPIPFGTTIIVSSGDTVVAGQELTQGYKNPADILRINGIDAVYDYIILEVQKVYSSQSIGINDKHIEVITRQMTRKMRITDPGSTDMLPGVNVEKLEYLDANAEIQQRIDAGERDLMLAQAEPVLLGITKASLQTESFLSAASFQETTKVLTEAAIKGKVDHLLGLKENVLIGKLIPAGTGMPCYNDVEVEKINTAEDDEFYAKYGTVAIDRRDEEYAAMHGASDYEDDEIVSSSEMYSDEDDFDDEDDDMDSFESEDEVLDDADDFGYDGDEETADGDED